MKRTHILLCFTLAPGLATAEALDKYGVGDVTQGPTSQAMPATLAPQVLRVDPNAARQQKAIQLLRQQPLVLRKRSLAVFARQEQEAVARRDYQAAAYYRGIIEAVQRGQK